MRAKRAQRVKSLLSLHHREQASLEVFLQISKKDATLYFSITKIQYCFVKHVSTPEFAQLNKNLVQPDCLTWLSSSISTNSSLTLSTLQPVRGWISYSNSMLAQVCVNSPSVFSMDISFTDLSTIVFTSSSILYSCNASKSASVVLSSTMNFICKI